MTQEDLQSGPRGLCWRAQSGHLPYQRHTVWETTSRSQHTEHHTHVPIPTPCSPHTTVIWMWQARVYRAPHPCPSSNTMIGLWLASVCSRAPHNHVPLHTHHNNRDVASCDMQDNTHTSINARQGKVHVLTPCQLTKKATLPYNFPTRVCEVVWVCGRGATWLIQAYRSPSRHKLAYLFPHLNLVQYPCWHAMLPM